MQSFKIIKFFNLIIETFATDLNLTLYIHFEAIVFLFIGSYVRIHVLLLFRDCNSLFMDSMELLSRTASLFRDSLLRFFLK